MDVTDLPHLNAALNAMAGVLLTAGFFFIRARRIAAHRRCMVSAFFVSALFLASYVFTILIPHVILAAAVLPLALITLRRGLRRDDERHRRLARWTLPIWLFVSVTGVVVYLMLYQLTTYN